MANDTTITIVGNLTADPELRVTQTGFAVVAFTGASTPRYFDKKANEWRDGEALFLSCSAWRDPAEHVAGARHAAHRHRPASRMAVRACSRLSPPTRKIHFRLPA